MQQFNPYYTGALAPMKDNHLNLDEPLGSKNAASIQKSFRTSDIDEVGDDTHLTFFEMLGNFSFGGYFKKESIQFGYDFIVKELGLEIDFVSVFGGDEHVPADTESEELWHEIGVENIRRHGREDNFWGPTGNEGPCGPTTEIYVKNAKGDSVEVWNIVFNEYYCHPDQTLTKLDIRGVDTGMGLERLAMVVQNADNLFETDLFAPIMSKLPESLWNNPIYKSVKLSVYPDPLRLSRIIADHTRAICFLISDGVKPSNKEAGYILRRLIRRVVTHNYLLRDSIPIDSMFNEIQTVYGKYYTELNLNLINKEFQSEKDKFLVALKRGLKELETKDSVDAVSAFTLYETYGLPYEIIKEIGDYRTRNLTREAFEEEFKKHQELSRTSSAGAFKGGLVDHEPQTVKHHTAHHLLLAALRHVLGDHVYQRGSNVSSERLRIDFSQPEKMTPEQIKQVEEIVNQRISEDLEVRREEMPKEEAEKLGALAEFGAKYGEKVSVYTIFNKDSSVFSREFCGGPHVNRTGELGRFKISKEEASSAGVRRIKAALE